MASAVNPITGQASSPASNNAAAGTSLSKPPTEQMFLNLLVAQMKNQDPLNPTDSTQFVSQLAQFSQLEQVIGIRQDIESYAAQQAAAATSGTTSGGNTGSGTTGTGQSS
jgi:flagellar basal-body rod modification protein FlgD